MWCRGLCWQFFRWCWRWRWWGTVDWSGLVVEHVFFINVVATKIYPCSLTTRLELAWFTHHTSLWQKIVGVDVGGDSGSVCRHGWDVEQVLLDILVNEININLMKIAAVDGTVELCVDVGELWNWSRFVRSEPCMIFLGVDDTCYRLRWVNNGNSCDEWTMPTLVVRQSLLYRVNHGRSCGRWWSEQPFHLLWWVNHTGCNIVKGEPWMMILCSKSCLQNKD